MRARTSARILFHMNRVAANLTEFVETLAVYFETAKKRHGQAWLCSLRTAMRMDREEFNTLAFAAHQEGLIELGRADLTDASDERYLTESALEAPRGTYTFHFLRGIES